jgi:hypothetical protein
MVDQQLYKEILLAVAARKQNERVYDESIERLERHMGQIESRRMKVADTEKEAMGQFALTLRNTQNAHRDAHYVRMKAVLKEVNELKYSMASAATEKNSAEDIQVPRHQVEQYGHMLPVYTARIRDAENINKD